MSPGTRTKAVTEANSFGVAKPDGTRTDKTVVPGATGLNSVIAVEPPFVNTTGEAVITPTPGSPLITSTLTDRPPANACCST
jgi:hypothetical protein